jgi:hypothetical protein
MPELSSMVAGTVASGTMLVVPVAQKDVLVQELIVTSGPHHGWLLASASNHH